MICPGKVSTDNRYERLSTDRSDCRLSFASPVGLLLPCNHIYNQYILIDDGLCQAMRSRAWQKNHGRHEREADSDRRKKECGTAPGQKGNTKGDYLLHAWVTENSLLLGQEKVRDKENEIPAIPRMLDRLVIDGAVVSIDAMGTQVDIAEKIVGKNAHYFLAVKENQAGLLSEIQDVIKYNQPTSTYSVTEKEHARVETRAVSIYPADMMEDKEIFGRWKNLRTLVCVETERVHVSEGGRTEVQTRYYISDEDFPLAQYYGESSPEGTGVLKTDCTGISMSRSRRTNAAPEKECRPESVIAQETCTPDRDAYAG